MSEAAQSEEKAQTGRAWIWIALLGGLLFLVPVFLLLRPAAQASARAGVAVKHGFIQLDNEEGALLFQAMQIRRGESIYHSLKQPPYVAGTYTPGFMAAVAGLDDFSNPGFATGRIVVWFSALSAAVLLVLMVLMTTRNPALGVLAGFLFLATWEVYRWIGYFRVDFPAMALALAGLALVVLSRRRWWDMAGAAFLMTAALYTRQTMIAAPAACVVALFLARKADAAKFLGWMLLWGLPPLIWLQVATGGEFLRHIILYNMNTSSLFNLQVWWRHALFMHGWFFWIAALGLPILLWMAVSERAYTEDAAEAEDVIDRSPTLFYFWQPLAWYAVFAQWNFLAIAKAGSAENYLLEPIAGWAIIVTLVAAWCLRSLGARGAPAGIVKRWMAVGFVVIALGGLTAHAWRVSRPQEVIMRFDRAKNPGRMDFEAASAITSLMREAENPLSELAIYNLRSGHSPVLQPFIMSELARQGRWDEAGFVRDLADGRFDVVVTLEDVTSELFSENYTREMLAAFNRTYQVDQVIQTPLWRYVILRPKAGWAAVAGKEIAAGD